MRPEDLAKLVLVSGPDAGGGRVLFTVTRISLEQNRYESSVWVYDIDHVIITGPTHNGKTSLAKKIINPQLAR
jgi:dipeptidyl aminopeptidase/acylaminoacyl peptidase